MRFFSKLFVVVSSILLLSGCATVRTINLSPQQRTEIHRVKIASTIATPNQLYYLGPGFGMTHLFFGLPGDLVEANKNESTSSRLLRYAQYHNINISQLVREALTQSLHRNTHFQYITNGNADATITASIAKFGFSIPNGFSSHVKPLLVVNVTMRNRSGQVIWQTGASVMPFTSGIPSYTPAQLNASTIKKSWQIAAQRVATEIAKSLAA